MAARRIDLARMHESTTSDLLKELTRSYSLQVELYKKLNAIVHRIYGQLVVSRGNVSGVMPLFEEKQKILNAISAERERTQQSAQSWQQKKAGVSRSDETARLDSILSEAEGAIRTFLDTEQQLERYLKHLAEQEGGVSG